MPPGCLYVSPYTIWKFDPFGLSVKNLYTKNVIARCNSFGDLYPFSPLSNSASTFIAAPGVKLCPTSSVLVSFLVIKMI
jgi:hypothetical protein